MTHSALPYLNIGCGNRFHRDRTKADLWTTDDVMAVDVRRPLPFADQSFRVVYHSHVLEHLTCEEARRFLGECYRITAVGGTIRVVVPDLEGMVREYLRCLQRAIAGEAGAEQDYDWMMLELYDQTVREVSGGRIREYLRHPALPNRDFVLQRWGQEARRILEGAPAPPPRSWMAQIRRACRYALPTAADLWDRLTSTSHRYRALQVGLFRASGELHQWMYDRYSLARLLTSAGYVQAAPLDAATSRIPDWKDFHLDTEPDGTVYKPDSLFMEATRPADGP